MEPAELDALIDRFATEGDSALLDSLEAAIAVSDGTAEVERLNRVMADLSNTPPPAATPLTLVRGIATPRNRTPSVPLDDRPARMGLALGMLAAMASVVLLSAVPVASPDPDPVWRGAETSTDAWADTLQEGLRREFAPRGPMLVRVTVDSAGGISQLEVVDTHTVLDLPSEGLSLPLAPEHLRGATLDVWIR